MAVTKAQVKAVLELIRTVADLIRELGEVPSGHLYARLLEYLPSLSAERYEQIIAQLVAAKVVHRTNHLLTWIGTP